MDFLCEIAAQKSGRMMQQEFILVKGSFTPAESKEILSNLLSSKINFHHMKNLSEQERRGVPDAASVIRMAELKKSFAQMMEILENAQQNHKNISIHSTIQIVEIH